ncbi:MAG: MFS transporter [Flavobacteriales bacterium]
MSILSFFKSNIFPILLVNFIGILGYSVVIPILIFIVTDFGGNGFIYGLLGAAYPFFQFIGAPILGKMSDRIGRKKVLIISQLGTFLAWCLFLIAFILPNTIIWQQDTEITGSYMMTLPLICIFIARMFDGFTGGNISVANAYMSDISTDENRSKNFGKMGSSTSLGFVIGPAFAGILASTALGETLPLIIAAVISLIAIFVINFRLKESNPCVVETGGISFKNFRRFFQVEHKDCYTEGSESVEEESTLGWRSVLKIEGIPLLYTVYFLNFMAFSLFYAGLPIYVSTILGWSSADLGLFLAYFSFIMVIVQGPVLSWFTTKTSSFNLVILGAALLGIGFVLLYRQDPFILYMAATLMALGNGLMWASFLSVLSSTGSPTKQGAIQGYGSSMGSIASMTGLILGGLLFESIANSVFLIGSGLFGLIVLLMLLSKRKQSQTILTTGKSKTLVT